MAGYCVSCLAACLTAWFSRRQDEIQNSPSPPLHQRAVLCLARYSQAICMGERFFYGLFNKSLRALTGHLKKTISSYLTNFIMTKLLE